MWSELVIIPHHLLLNVQAWVQHSLGLFVVVWFLLFPWIETELNNKAELNGADQTIHLSHNLVSQVYFIKTSATHLIDAINPCYFQLLQKTHSATKEIKWQEKGYFFCDSSPDNVAAAIVYVFLF